ncbi:hypothetical protein OROMI_016749 [Orobanche minor]
MDSSEYRESGIGSDLEVEEEESDMGSNSEVEEKTDMVYYSEVEEDESESESDSHWKQELAVASPLFKAIFEENTKGIKDFLSVEGINIDINCGSIDGDPFNIIDALYWACYYGHVQSVKALLANGADPEKKPIHITPDGPVIHAACFGGLEALHVAASLEDREVVEYLLQHGANPCIPDMLKKYPYEHARAGTPLFYILKKEYEMQVDMRYQEQLIKMRRKKMMRKRLNIRGKGMRKMLEASAPAAGSPNPPASQV